MKKNRRFISLILALTMIVTAFSGLTVVNAEGESVEPSFDTWALSAATVSATSFSATETDSNYWGNYFTASSGITKIGSGNAIELGKNKPLIFNLPDSKSIYYFHYTITMGDGENANTVSLEGLASGTVFSSPLSDTTGKYEYITIVDTNDKKAYTYLKGESGYEKKTEVTIGETESVTGIKFSSSNSNRIILYNFSYGEANVATDTHYTYIGGVHKWNMVGLYEDLKDNEGIIINKDSITRGSKYNYHGLAITMGKDAAFGTNGLTCKSDASVEYTPEKNGVLTISGKLAKGATVSVIDTTKEESDENYMLYTYKNESDSTVVVPENTIELGVGTNYKVTIADAVLYLTDLTFKETQTDPQQEETPAVTINYETEKLEGFVEGGDYTIAIDDGSAETVILSGTTADIEDAMLGMTLKIVKKGDGETTADSEEQELTIPARPDAPTTGWTIDYDNKTITISSSLYTSTAANSYTETAQGSGTAVDFVTGSTKYVYTPAVTEGDNKAFKSAIATITAPTAASAPQASDVTIDYEAETLSAANTIEYSTDNGVNWAAFSSNPSLKDKFSWTGEEKTIKIRTKADSPNYASEAVTFTIPARDSAPSVQGVKPETESGSGKITGVNKTMEYKASADQDWTAVGDVAEIEVVPGDYQVRVKKNNENKTFESAATNVTVPDYEAVLANPTITVTTPNTAEGTLTVTVGGQPVGETAQETSVLTVTAEAKSGYTLSKIEYKEGTGSWTEVANNGTITVGKENIEIKATFTQDKYTINVGSVSNGTVAPQKNSDIVYNDDVVVTITPDTGYELGTFTVNGEEKTVTGDTYTLTVTGNTTLSATFIPETYTVTYNTDHGTVDEQYKTYNYGVGIPSLPQLTDSGFDFGGWWTGEGGTGEQVTAIGTNEHGTKTFYAKWTATQSDPDPEPDSSLSDWKKEESYSADFSDNTTIAELTGWTAAASDKVTVSDAGMAVKESGAVTYTASNASKPFYYTYKIKKTSNFSLSSLFSFAKLMSAGAGSVTLAGTNVELVDVSDLEEGREYSFTTVVDSTEVSTYNNEDGSLYGDKQTITTGSVTGITFTAPDDTNALVIEDFSYGLTSTTSHYSYADGLHTWSFVGMDTEIDGYNAESFSSTTEPATYTYKGLTMKGGNQAKFVANDGLKLYKSGTLLSYTPTKDGTLTLVLKTITKDAELSVNTATKKDTTDDKANGKVYQAFAANAGDATVGDIKLQAGQTYYIQNYASKNMHLAEMTFQEEEAAAPSPTATTAVVDPTPTAAATAVPSATKAPTPTAAATAVPSATKAPTPTAAATAVPSATEAPTATAEPEATLDPTDTHYTYINGVRTWNFVNFNKDAETLLNGYNKDTFASDTPKSYDYQGLSIESRGNVAAIDPTGLKTYVDKGVYIEYTPKTNGTLAVSIYATSTGAAICVGTDPSKADEATKLYTTTADDSKKVIDLEQTVELTAGTTYYIWNSANKTAHIQKLVFTEEGQATPEPTTEPTASPTAKPEETPAATSAPAETAKPSGSHYSYINNTHTWEFIGLEGELTGFDGEIFKTVENTHYDFNNLSIYGKAANGNTTNTAFDTNGLISDKGGGYIVYTPSKDGTLEITIQANQNSELYVDEGAAYTKSKTLLYKKADSAGAMTESVALEADKTYYIYNGSGTAYRLRKLAYVETNGTEPTPTPGTDTTPSPAVTTPPSTESPDKPKAYIKDGDTQTWNVVSFRGVLSDFTDSAFDTGMSYTYEGLTLNGGSGAVLSDNGMLIKKLAGGDSVTNTVAFTPTKSGTLTVTADAAAVKAEVYVGTRVDKGKSTRIIYSETQKGILTGTINLTAGSTYYIFSGASVDVSIRQVVFKEDAGSPVVTPVPGNPSVTPNPNQIFDATDTDKIAVSNASEGGTYEYSTDTRYPVDITSARSGVRTIASGLNVAKSSQHLAFEMTLNTLLKENTTASGAPDTFALEFTSGTGRVGGMLVAKTQTKVDGKDAMLLDWRTGSWQNKLTKPLVVGEKYTFDLAVNTTKDGDTETLDTIDLYVYDKDGKLYDYALGLNRRNATALQIIYLMAQPRTVGENDSVTIENVRTFYYKPESTLLEIAKGNSKEKLNTDTVYAITSDKFNDTEWEFKKPYSLLSDGSTASYMATAIELKKADGSSLPQNISFDASSRKIKASSGLMAGEYELKATVISSYNGKEVLREDYPITLSRPEVSPEDVMNDYTPTIEYNGKALTTDTVVTDDIALPTSNSVVALKWNSYNTGVISNTGVVTRPLDDTEVTLEVEIASVEDPTKTKKETITVKVQGVRLMLEDAIAKAKAGITSADDGRVMDADALNDLHEDIKFIAKYKNSDFIGYEQVSYTWVSDSDYLKVADETAEIYPKAVRKYNANLTLTAKYKNQKLDEVIPVTINLTSENAADKYAVRADSIALENFSSIESYVGKTVSDDISLPTKGIFGSTISWTSSAPAYMSNTGKYKMPSNNTKVTLSAIISKGSVMSDKEKTFKMTLKGKSNESSSGGGGGGGGSSSSSKTSTFTTAGTSSAPVYVPPTNQNTNGSQNGSTEPTGRFDDLSTAAWAEEAINTLADKGIISGRGDRIFAPNDDITRAEFATIIVNTFNIFDENAECDGLSDVSEDAWYYRYIASAYNNGIISGYDDGRFGVNDKITRQDMAVIIFRAMNSLGVEFEEVEDEIIFSDSDSISDYAKAAVTALQKADIVNGVGDDEFAPLATATRAQAAVIIFNTQR